MRALMQNSIKIALLFFLLNSAYATELPLDSLRSAFKKDGSDELIDAKTKAIYGEDDRLEVVDADLKLRRAARSVAALFDRGDLSVTTVGKWQLPKTPTLQQANWCSDERFADQIAAAKCTGFLVAPDKLATSAHCVRADNKEFEKGPACSTISVVFDYAISSSGKITTQLDSNQLFQCKEVLGRYLDPQGADWSLIQLDREVPDRKPLGLFLSKVLPVSARFSVIGHPLGLPTKVSINGKLLDKSRPAYFVTDLDTYEGNSGSPVFVEHPEKNTLIVAGILSRGDLDFDSVLQDNGQTCRRSRMCAQTECQGEHVTRASQLPILPD